MRQLTDETELDDLRVDLILRPASVLGDPDLFRTMAGNLIDNAVLHNGADGWIGIRTESAGPERNGGIAMLAGRATSRAIVLRCAVSS